MFPGHGSWIDTVNLSCKLLLCWSALEKPGDKQITILRLPSVNVVDVKLGSTTWILQMRLEK